MHTIKSLSGAGLVLAFCAGTARAQEFHLLPIDQGLAESISDNGIASGSFGYDLAPQYFYWTASGGVQAIGAVAPGNGIGGQGKISNDGRYISGTDFNPATGLHEMSRYDRTTGVWTPLGSLGGSSGAEASSGWAISGDGQSVAGLAWIDPGTAHGAQWSGGAVTDLGSIVPGESTRVNGVNYDGTVQVGWQDGAGRQGAVWVNGVEELIFLPSGAVAFEAFDVSGDGRWVTGIGFGSFFSAAQTYRYDTVNDVTELIPNLAVGAGSRMGGACITDDGTLIGGGTWGFGPATLGNGFVWQEGVGTMTVAEYLDAHHVDYPADFRFAFVSAMSSDGDWIAGWGDIGGPANVQTWVAKLTPSSVSAQVDVKPGSCSNPFNPVSNGVLPVAILGSGAFDAAMIDVSSVTLSRADGVGGTAFPLEGPPGPHSVLTDVGTAGAACDGAEGDGLLDLSMKFRTDELSAALLLGDEAPGSVVELNVAGTLLDGTPFSGTDAVTIVPPGASNLTVSASVPDLFVGLAPMDLNTDADGFTSMARLYARGTEVELTAPGSPVWYVDGVRVANGSSVVVRVGAATQVRVVYPKRGTFSPR